MTNERVIFRPGFSDKLTGMIFVIDTEVRTDAGTGRAFVGLRLESDARKVRQAWCDDLIEVEAR